MGHSPTMGEFLGTDAPTNWGKWGPEDEVGCALMRNLGVTMTEICSLDDLTAACAEDGRWSFLYTAAPLKVVEATGAPVNPVVIR